MDLGANVWFLIVLTLFEIFFIVIPASISAKIEGTSFHQELNNMGLEFQNNPIKIKVQRIVLGLAVGFGFFLIGRYIAFFFRNVIIEQIFGSSYIQQAQEGSINTTPISPNLLQLAILIILQIFLVGLCEEAFFRGFLLSKLNYKFTPASSALISSLFFALYHVPPFLVPLSTIVTFFGYYFTFGILLSFLYRFSNHSLLPCIIAHSFFNSLLILL